MALADTEMVDAAVHGYKSTTYYNTTVGCWGRFCRRQRQVGVGRMKKGGGAYWIYRRCLFFLQFVYQERCSKIIVYSKIFFNVGEGNKSPEGVLSLLCLL